MKKMFISGLLFLICISSYSQNLDLVVTARGDSIACKIDSITESAIYLQIKTFGNVNWIQTIYNKEDIHLFKYGNIDPSKYAFKEGTSKIIGPVQPVYPSKFPDWIILINATNEELNFYLLKARKTKTTGAIMIIAGSIAATAGILLTSNSSILDPDNGDWATGALLAIVGLPTSIVGIPLFIAGSSRVKSVNKIKESRGMTMEFIPGGFYNFQANSYQPGGTLRIRF